MLFFIRWISLTDHLYIFSLYWKVAYIVHLIILYLMRRHLYNKPFSGIFLYSHPSFVPWPLQYGQHWKIFHRFIVFNCIHFDPSSSILCNRKVRTFFDILLTQLQQNSSPGFLTQIARTLRTSVRSNKKSLRALAVLMLKVHRRNFDELWCWRLRHFKRA